MKTLKLFLITVFFLSVQTAQADFMNANVGSDSDEAIIVAEYFTNTGWEEPVFSSRKIERNVANLVFENRTQDYVWQGQLVVLKEIPYTYATSRHLIQMRTLIEIEEQEKAKENL